MTANSARASFVTCESMAGPEELKKTLKSRGKNRVLCRLCSLHISSGGNLAACVQSIFSIPKCYSRAQFTVGGVISGPVGPGLM